MEHIERLLCRLSAFLIAFALMNSVSAQDRIAGIIKSADGSPVSGATVTVKETGAQTVSDDDGRFIVPVPKGSTLEITSVSYVPRQVKASNNLVITLENRENILEEVEVMVDKGYGKSKRNSVSSVISTVKGTELQGMPSTNLGSVLQGRATGVQVTNSGGANPPTQKILIRGFTSLQNSTDPLIIMDGVNLGRTNLNFINLADVETVDILKDASAAAIYGSDASGGVIIITTKKGKAGKFASNADISYGTSFYEDPGMADANEYMEIQKRRNPSYTPPADAANTNWWKESIKSAPLINANINFSGGSDKLLAFGSISYLKTEGNYKVGDANWEKIIGRLNLEFTPSKYFKLGFTLNPRYETWVNSGQNDLMPVMRTEPTLPVYINRPELNKYSQFSQTNIDRNANPIAVLTRNVFNKNRAIGFIGATYGEVNPLKNLKLRSQISINTAQTYTSSYIPRYYNGNRDYNFNPSDPSTLDLSDYASNKSDNAFNWIWTNTINYSYSINDKHSFNALAGYEARQQFSEGNTASRYKSQDPDNPSYYYVTYMQGDYRETKGYRDQDTWGAVFGRLNYEFDNKYFIEGNIRRDVSSRFFENNKHAVFPSVSVGWIATNENFLKSFGALSYLKIRASYGEIGNSSFNDPAVFVNFLSNNYNGLNVVTFGDPRTGYPIYTVARPSNPDLKWERDIDQNIGFDSYWFKSRLYVNFELYKRIAKDLLYTDPVGREDLGIPPGQVLNIGQISNRGWEASVGYRSSSNTSGFKYDVSVNLSHNIAVLDSYGLTGDPVLGTAQGFYRLSEELQGPYSKSEIGGIIGRYWGYEVMKVFQNQNEIDNYRTHDGVPIQPSAQPGDFMYRDVNDDGLIDDLDRVFLGSPYPKIDMGINLRFEYKNIDLSVSGYGRFGQKNMWFGKKFFVMGSLGSNVLSGSIDKAWNGEGSTNEYPRFVQDGVSQDLLRFNSWFVEKGDYFRLNNVQLGYTIPSSLMRGIRSLRIYVNAQNIATISKYSGINPEIYNNDLPIYANGVDISQYPVKKTITAGISVGF